MASPEAVARMAEEVRGAAEAGGRDHEERGVAGVALNRGSIGTTYPAVTFVVDAGRVAAFAGAVGHPAGGVPPTFVTAPEVLAGLTNVLGDPDLGVDLARVLHGEQRYRWHRALSAGEILTATATIEDIRGRPALEFLTLRTEIRGADGELVCEGRSTLLHRGEA